MAESKHTAGPWRTFNGTDVYPDDNDTEATRHIADCSMAGVIGGDEQLANARLVAAAPDLLAACQAVLDEFPAFDGKRIESIKRICRDAISKATTA